jgi:hypothetical protein
MSISTQLLVLVLVRLRLRLRLRVRVRVRGWVWATVVGCTSCVLPAAHWFRVPQIDNESGLRWSNYENAIKHGSASLTLPLATAEGKVSM